MVQITASKLYDYMMCPHRIWRDKWGPQTEKDQKVNPFIQMLWERGIQHEKETILSLSKDKIILDLSTGNHQQRFNKTIKALKEGTPYVYQGVLISGNLLGIPDLLELQPDGSFLPVDIKSGMALEGIDDKESETKKPKKHYAVQLSLYAEALINLGFQKKHLGKIIDSRGEEVVYQLDQQIGKLTPFSYWEKYQEVKYEGIKLLDNRTQNKPAIAGVCKLCPWYQSCKKWAKETDDLTNVFYLGRSKRDRINEDLGIERVEDVSNIDLIEVSERKKKNKKFLSGVGEKTLEKIIIRADIFANKKPPVVYGEISFPEVTYELFFDIEDDPTQEFVYLHGVYERNKKAKKERFLDFTAREKTTESEKKAWSEFWQYIRSLPENDFAVYYYSPHEKTTYKKMQKLYPGVISKEEVDDFFESPNVIDLYQIVLKQTDWPLSSYSIKAIAVYLGFSWRDESPSGALSIQWFNEYLKTKNEKVLKRILEYNEDDCKATMVVKDGIKILAEKKEGTKTRGG